jgi:hypothetical protein
MVSEAIAVHLPVVGILPAGYTFKPKEARYRVMMEEKGWARFIHLKDLSVERFSEELGKVRPPKENHLDRLAGMIQRKLPSLFSTEAVDMAAV